MSKRLYMCVNVRGLICHLRSLRKNQRTHLTDDNGRPLSREQAIDALMDEIASGHEVIPMNKGCGNPCENSPNCAGFCFKEGGCPGYEAEDTETAEPDGGAV